MDERVPCMLACVQSVPLLESHSSWITISFLCLLFKDRVSQSPGWPQTHFVAEDELEAPSASVSRVMGFRACASTADVCGARNQTSSSTLPTHPWPPFTNLHSLPLKYEAYPNFRTVRFFFHSLHATTLSPIFYSF